MQNTPTYSHDTYLYVKMDLHLIKIKQNKHVIKISSSTKREISMKTQVHSRHNNYHLVRDQIKLIRIHNTRRFILIIKLKANKSLLHR